MNHGLTRPTLKHKDLDFAKSFGTIGVTPAFPPEFNTDAGFGMPNQNAEGQPNGCTNYAQAEIANDLTGKKHNPVDLEEVTHANARGGYDIRDSLDAARKIGWFKWYFNIQSYNLDWFDSIRYAQLMGVQARELRTVTCGLPWFPSWEAAIQGNIVTKNPDGSYTTSGGGVKSIVMPMPTQDELDAVKAGTNHFGWHDSVLNGWKTINGVLVLRDKSFQGPTIGDGGYIYFPREVINVVMNIKWAVAYTGTMLDAPNNARISLPLFDWLKSFIRNFPLAWHY